MQAKTTDTLFEQFFLTPEVGVSQWRRQTHKQTDVATLNDQIVVGTNSVYSILVKYI